MQDTTLYAQILGVESPWRVTAVTPRLDEGEVVVKVDAPAKVRLACPKCGVDCPRHDHRARRWRHLPTCQYRTILEVDVPRVRCEEHGVLQVPLPSAEENSAFTALYEALVISWLKKASISAVAERMDLSWDQMDGIMQRAVRRGLARRQPAELRRIGIDETSFQNRHEYVTVVIDQERSSVLDVADDRRASSLEPFFDGLEPPELVRIESVSMDMWKPYISVVRANLWGADRKICFDRFHVAKHLGEAVDKVRRGEQRSLMAAGDRTLAGTKYTWLQNPQNMGSETASSLRSLRTLVLKTARAWAIEEEGMGLWGDVSRTWAREAWSPLVRNGREAPAGSRSGARRATARASCGPSRGRDHSPAVGAGSRPAVQT